MKKVALAIAGLTCLVVASLKAAEPISSMPGERFYGKIAAIDVAKKNLTVRNKKQQLDAHFQWNDQTTVLSDSKEVKPTELKIGQSLIVSYVTENDINKAQRITVTHPFKKKSQQ